MQVVLPENPVRENVLVVERNGARARPANETAIPLDDVSDETVETKMQDAAVAVDYGAIFSLVEQALGTSAR